MNTLDKQDPNYQLDALKLDNARLREQLEAKEQAIILRDQQIKDLKEAIDQDVLRLTLRLCKEEIERYQKAIMDVAKTAIEVDPKFKQSKEFVAMAVRVAKFL